MSKQKACVDCGHPVQSNIEGDRCQYHKDVHDRDNNAPESMAGDNGDDGGDGGSTTPPAE